MMESCKSQWPLCAPGCSSHNRLFRKSTTYLTKIAVILQDAPGKMLTFTQLMDKLRPLMCEERKSVENNIRVCLSANKCFVKVPLFPDSLDSKRNYWKLDSSQITSKMVRRHFKGLLHLFPELAPETMRRTPEFSSALLSPEAAPCTAVQTRCEEVKFSGPFSIESLLKRDGASGRPCRAAPQPQSSLGSASGTKRSSSWDCDKPPVRPAAAAWSLIRPTGGSTHHRLCAPGAMQQPIRRMHVSHEQSFPVYTGTSTAPYFPSTGSSCLTYSVPTFPHDALHFSYLQTALI